MSKSCWLFLTFAITIILAYAWKDLYLWGRYSINGQIFFSTIIALILIIGGVWIAESRGK